MGVFATTTLAEAHLRGMETPAGQSIATKLAPRACLKTPCSVEWCGKHWAKTFLGAEPMPRLH